MRKKIDYALLVEKALKCLDTVNELSHEFLKDTEIIEEDYMVDIREEMKEVIKLSNITNFKGNDKNTYYEIMENTDEIDGILYEVSVILCPFDYDTLKKMRKLIKLSYDEGDKYFDFKREGYIDYEGYYGNDRLFDLEDVNNLIDRAIKKRCFIEVISLVHNNIEFNLKHKVIKFIRENKKSRLLIKNRKYLSDYLEVCYLLNLINEEIYEKITKFNRLRNIVIHKLFGSKKIERYREAIETAKLGTEIKFILDSYLSKKDISERLKLFDISEKEAKKDPYVNVFD